MMYKTSTQVLRAAVGLILISVLVALAGCDEVQTGLNALIPPLPGESANGPSADTGNDPGAGADPAPVSGPAWYVDATGGSDSNAGTAAAPWKTLAKAGQAARAGDTVIVKAGTYNEALVPSASGTAAARITFRSETPRAAKILRGVRLPAQDYVRIEGFDVTNPSGFGIQVQDFYGSAHGQGIQLVGNYVHGAGGGAYKGVCTNSGIAAYNAKNLLVENNECYDNGDAGIMVVGAAIASGGVRDITVRGNYVHWNESDCLKIGGNNLVIENNRMGDSYGSPDHQDGIECYGPVDGMIIRNNRIWDTTQNIYLSAESSYIRNVQVLGNVVWNQNNPNGGKGIIIGPNVGDVTNLRIEGNTFGYNAINIVTDGSAQSPGYYITGLTIRNNIFYMCPLTLSLHNPAVIDNNLLYKTGGFGVAYNGTMYTSPAQMLNATGQHWYSYDPLLVNPGARDFHLQAGSPCINAGVPVAGLTSDPDGNPRPLGGAFDLGAYEGKK